MAILNALAELVILRSHQRHSWPIFLAMIAKSRFAVTHMGTPLSRVRKLDAVVLQSLRQRRRTLGSGRSLG